MTSSAFGVQPGRAETRLVSHAGTGQWGFLAPVRAWAAADPSMYRLFVLLDRPDAAALRSWAAQCLVGDRPYISLCQVYCSRQSESAAMMRLALAAFAMLAPVVNQHADLAWPLLASACCVHANVDCCTGTGRGPVRIWVNKRDRNPRPHTRVATAIQSCVCKYGSVSTLSSGLSLQAFPYH